MTPVEILLWLADTLAFCALAIQSLRAISWIGYLAPIALLIAGIQVLVEGARWEMVPAYALAILFFLIWLARILKLPAIHPDTNRIVSGVGIGLGMLALVISVALPIALPVFHFPNPTGLYAIGTVTYHWIDTSRHEIFSTDPNARRELMVQVWYPTRPNSARRAPYVQDASALSRAEAPRLHLPGFALDQFGYVTADAAASVPMAPDKPNFPVLIYLEGLSGFRQVNTFQVQELVSHGYVVAAIDQPYAAAVVVFPDGHEIMGWTRDQMQPLINQSLSPTEPAPLLNGQPLRDGIISYFAQDVSFTLDQLTALQQNDPKGILTGRLDLQHVGVFGISLGAIVAGEGAHTDPRVKAALMMDAAMPANVVRDGLRQPSMWITRDAGTMRLERQRSGGWSEADIAQTLDTMRAVFDKSAPGNGYYVSIPGMFHVNFTDAPYWSPLFPLLGVVGPINAQRGFDIVNAYSVAFFDQKLEDKPAPLLEGAPKRYPEVLYEGR